ncbi:MAG: FtsX-like permease family protein [Dysgonamonadaceae bacterium]|nr:FtsX-like permease family protein [Dysgonamonadaceae bacterium]
MNSSFYIARRYLFSKKSHNSINLISIVAVCGICIVTAAMVCTVSVFGGFQDLVAKMCSSFDPELKITSVKGKTFDAQDEKILEIKSLPSVEQYVEAIEDNVLIRYKNRQVPAIIKGVSDNFGEMTDIEKVLIDGEFKLHTPVNSFCSLGVGLAMKLGMNAGFMYPLEICVPKRNEKVNLVNPAASLTSEYAYITGVFAINQEMYDEHLLIAPLSLARLLFDYGDDVSAIELKLKAGESVAKLQSVIQQKLGDGYSVQNRYQQHESTFKMMTVEKWVTFLILSFICLIAVFNVVSSLSMLMVEKKQDIVILRDLGMTSKSVSRIFLFEGWMISAIGACSGTLLGLLLCFLQLRFGLLKLGDTNGAFIVSDYPVIISFRDTFIVWITVLILGFLAAIYPINYLSKKRCNFDNHFLRPE